MQQPIPSVPALPALVHPHGHVPPARFDATELDVGYEVAFPFLTEKDLTDAD